MKEYFKKLMLEFITNDKGEPVYPKPEKPSQTIHDIATKHGYFTSPTKNVGNWVIYTRKDSNMHYDIHHNIDNGKWGHQSYNNVYMSAPQSGSKPEELDGYLESIHNP